jgi:Glyoxalase-like domain
MDRIGAEGHLRMDVRADRVILSLQTAAVSWVTEQDVELARAITAVVDEMRLETVSGSGDGGGRSVQVIEIGIDTLDAAAIRPFWRALLGYADEPGRSGPWDGLVDPRGQGPAVWFQRMDAPRPQRNRLHFDVSVPHDEAGSRIQAAPGVGRDRDQRRARPRVLGAGRRRGQRGLRHDLAGPGLGRAGVGSDSCRKTRRPTARASTVGLRISAVSLRRADAARGGAAASLRRGQVPPRRRSTPATVAVNPRRAARCRRIRWKRHPWALRRPRRRLSR